MFRCVFLAVAITLFPVSVRAAPVSTPPAKGDIVQVKPSSKKVLIQKETPETPATPEVKPRPKQKQKKEPIVIPSNRKPNKWDYKNTAGETMPSYMPLWFGVYVRGYKLDGGN